MRFALFRSNAGLRVSVVSAAALGALGCAAAFAQSPTPSISTGDLTSNFSEMAKLKTLASQGKGKIGVLLPETTTSARYTSFDEPYLKQAFEKAGLSAGDVIITNAQGSELTEMTQAQSDITQGARVLVMDPISSGVGASIESYAKSHGVPGHRLRPADPRRRPRLLRELQQRRSRQDDRPGHGRVRLGLEGEEPGHPGDARRSDRQQRDPVRRRLHGRAEAGSRIEQIQTCRRTRRNLGPGHGAHDLRGPVQGPSEHQRRGHAERRHRQRRDLLSEVGQDPAGSRFRPQARTRP